MYLLSYVKVSQFYLAVEARLKFFTCDFREKNGFFENKKFFISVPVQVKNFYSLREYRGTYWLSYATNRKILACCGGEVEIF